MFQGNIIQPSEYHAVRDAWVALDGTLYSVVACGHYNMAVSTWGFDDVWQCERAGYIHISEYKFVNEIDPKPTSAQIDTLLLWCQAHSKPVPDWAVYPEEVVQDHRISNSYRTGISSRKMRDMLYPNSGD